MAKRTCGMPGCEKPHRAKGLCGTHYNQTQPNRHPTAEVACDGCGAITVKERRAARWKSTYCSEVCRTWYVYGVGWSVDLPRDHWARMWGATSEWTPPRSLDPIRCVWCDSTVEPTRSGQTHCSPACKLKAKRMRRRGREHDAYGEYTYSELVNLWVAFNKACAYCAQPTALTDIQPEHVHPLSRGGRNDVTNILPSCMPCNADKRDLLLTEWAADRQRRGLDARRTHWNPTDTRYLHLVHDLQAAA